jgi:hypothetical protein
MEHLVGIGERWKKVAQEMKFVENFILIRVV